MSVGDPVTVYVIDPSGRFATTYFATVLEEQLYFFINISE